MAEPSFMQIHVQQQYEKQKKGRADIAKQQEKDQQEKIIFLNKRIYIGMLIILIFAFIPSIFYVYMYDGSNIDKDHTCNILIAYRIPCGPENTTYKKCTAINCCFNDNTQQCYHYLPSKYQYQSTDADWKNGFKPKITKSPYGRENAKMVYLDLTPIDEFTVSFTINDKAFSRRNIPIGNEDKYNYKGTIYTNEMGVEILRKSTGDMLLSTSHGPTIISDKFWEWTIDLNTQNLFGLDQFRIKDNETITKVIYSNSIDHGVLPQFIAERNGSFYGLFIEHNGPMEITVLPSRLIIVRMLSGLPATFHLSIGPTPREVLNQQRIITPVVPPYWALGVHICRDGVMNTSSSAIQTVLKEYEGFRKSSSIIAYDSDCIHENLFSIAMDLHSEDEKNIIQALNNLKTDGKKFLMSLSSQLTILDGNAIYEGAKKYVYQDKKVFQGSYLERKVVYPYFKAEETKTWFKDALTKLTQKFLVPDGFVLRDNWPVNEDYKMVGVESFQYLSKALYSALSNTIPWDMKSPTTQQPHIAEHNNYGNDQTNAVIQATSTSFVLSASFGKGNKYGAHVQNVNTSWVSFKRMLSMTLSQGLFGTAIHSTPVCGGTDNFDEEINEAICVRWYIAAATLPIFRISSDFPRRDPVSVQSQHLLDVAQSAIATRYELLPYLYTSLLKNEFLNPMFLDFYQDNNTLVLDEQYMIGDSLLIAHPVKADISVLRIYLPSVSGGWFEFWGGNKYDRVGWISFPIVETDSIIFLAGGKIIPIQNNVDFTMAKNSDEIRKTPLSLAVALDCTEGCKASGSWSITDKATVSFTADDKTVNVTGINNIRQEICETKIATSVIESIRLYKTDTMVVSKVTKDLCLNNVDEIDIPL